jgi:dihydroxyacetone kinase-like protein
VDAEVTARWIRLVAERVADRREWLTELDSAIGDADHGINLDHGLAIVVARLDDGVLPRASDGDLLAAIGRTITGTVGGRAEHSTAAV